MKTSELVALLATGAGPAPRAVVARRLLPVVLAGGALSAALAIGVLGLVPERMLAGQALWTKIAYSAALMLAAGWLASRLARPAAPTGAAWRWVAAVVAVMVLAALAALATMPGAERLRSLLGHSWSICPWTVLALSLPALAGTLWALRGLAPTRPRAAGAAAGLLAGAAGACGYAWACTEESTVFVAAWYTLGIGLTAALGALLGPRALRW
ncbi:DUF1109 domain-containing protein [Ideonella sp. A 288]|uniref:DUF1109 domain-containing protein n=1 Tax=Ideonella sp. A 288 TaxID=1962181 RepID=UPI000B4BDB6F|nr:DUF1109 domain-containing protein [Ideonella sp. A 288]